MAVSDKKREEYIRRLLLSRMRILCKHGFFGLLLMRTSYALDECLQTAATDGRKIIFGVGFLEKLSDSELDFVMMHEIMHIILKHCMRREYRDNKLFNVACDIVVNSNILSINNMDLSSITLSEYGEAMHTLDDDSEGYLYTAEQVYAILENQAKHSDNECFCYTGSTWDDHTRWGKYANDSKLRDEWEKNIIDAALAVAGRADENAYDSLPLFVRRMLLELRKPQTNWRTILNNFIQEDIVDYSFEPPDRRFCDSPFFLPDFNEKEETVKDILFMIDMSGSMSNDMICAAYSEVKGAIDQFNGKLKGWLGFFDDEITEPKEFQNEEEFSAIIPTGGGCTDFNIIFEYVNTFMEKQPATIIILTDGGAEFPDEEIAMQIPVLWLLTTQTVTPPWGKVARITVD